MTIDEVVGQPARTSARANFLKTAEHIQMLAQRGATTVQRLGPVILFCANLDAWLLDPEDGLARCIMRRGRKLPLGIEDYGLQFGVRWNADFGIEGDQFRVRSFGQKSVCTLAGYPVQEIIQCTVRVPAN